MSLLAYVTFSVAFAACIQVIAAQSGSHDGTYQPIESCQTNQVCTYKYEAEQQEFGGEQQQNITVKALVEISCKSVGTYNDSDATEYCMRVSDTTLTGSILQGRSEEETRSEKSYINKLLAGWFCFVQTMEGKVPTVFHDSTDDAQAVNFKKAIAAAFQANFMGTEQEEETDPQSKHISHYRYLPTNEDGVQKMHRYVNSEDVEQYPDDTHPRDILLTKDEDIEYKSGILYHSSGTTFVEISISPQRKLQQFVDEEESSSNLTNPHTFSVYGSYSLDKIQCYTLSRSATVQRNRRSTGNLVETSLGATIDKRSIGRMHMEDLRQQLPSPSQILMKLHQEPENIQLASKLQNLLALEAQHGPLPGTTPALKEVLLYLENINQSQDARDIQMRKTIYSLLAQEGSLKSQMTLLHALLHGNDEEKDSIITHIAFIKNPNLDFVAKLEVLLTKKTATTDSLLLAYGALAATASSSVQQRIVHFLKRRLVQQRESNATTTIIHLLHALGNTGSKLTVNLLLDHLMHSNSAEVQIAAIDAMRKLTAQQSIQDAFITILESNPEEHIIEAITNTLVIGLEHSQIMGLHIGENIHLLNALVASALDFSNNTHLHQLILSYLETVNTAEYQRLEKSLEKSASKRAKRGTDWDQSSSNYDLVASQSSRRSDVTTYPRHKAYIWGNRYGPSQINVEFAAGAFGGASNDCDNAKLFGKAVARGNLFSRSTTLAQAEVLLQKDSTRLRAKLYARIGGTVLMNRDYSQDFSTCCLSENRPLRSSRYNVISYTHSIFIYVGTLDFTAGLYAELNVNLRGQICASASVHDPLHGSIAVVPSVSVVPEGSASVTLLAAVRGGISLAGVISYQLEPIASARMCASSCAATLQACSELYASRPGNYIEIYAWYQTRRVKMCRGRIWGRSFSYPCGFEWGSRHRWDRASVRWNLGGASRHRLWRQCYSPTTVQQCPNPITPPGNSQWCGTSSG